MIVLISPAKTYRKEDRLPSVIFEPTQAAFQKTAVEIARAALGMDRAELERYLGASPKVFKDGISRLRHLVDGSAREMPAALYFDGMVYKKLAADLFSPEDWAFAKEHLRMTSFVYGLLRPTDLLRPYRMEGNAVLPEPFGRLFDYWRDRLTPMLIKEAKDAGGVICYLASEEMKQLYHWEEVEASCRVIYPSFLTHSASTGKERQLVIYTKMARGEMARQIITEQITDPEQLKGFCPADYHFQEELSDEHKYTYIRIVD